VGLDPTQIIEIRSLIIELGKTRTVILSSHILSEVQAVCSRVVILNRGEIAADDTPENLAMAMYNNSSYTVLVEGDDAAVLRTLRSVPGVLDVERRAQEQSGVFEYAITGESKRDIRRDVSLALSSAGLCMLGTKQRDISFEHVFLELIRREAADDSGAEAGI
jgi:ABC-2 type transport system ATP-binding protein